MTSETLKFVADLEGVIQERLKNRNEDSYTAELGAAGIKRMAQKVGEEAIELSLASVTGDHDEVLNEAADLVYHLLVLLNAQQLRFVDVVDVLRRRHEPQ